MGEVGARLRARGEGAPHLVEEVQKVNCKLVRILLHPGREGGLILVECPDELRWVIVPAVRQGQIRKGSLEFEGYVDCLSDALLALLEGDCSPPHQGVVGDKLEDRLAERKEHIECLEHRVEVACVADVPQANGFQGVLPQRQTRILRTLPFLWRRTSLLLQ